MLPALSRTAGPRRNISLVSPDAPHRRIPDSRACEDIVFSQTTALGGYSVERVQAPFPEKLALIEMRTGSHLSSNPVSDSNASKSRRFRNARQRPGAELRRNRPFVGVYGARQTRGFLLTTATSPLLAASEVIDIEEQNGWLVWKDSNLQMFSVQKTCFALRGSYNDLMRKISSKALFANTVWLLSTGSAHTGSARLRQRAQLRLSAASLVLSVYSDVGAPKPTGIVNGADAGPRSREQCEEPAGEIVPSLSSHAVLSSSAR
jgi:hypothetical protein